MSQLLRTAWPSPLQKELLRAICLPAKLAEPSFTHWSRHQDLDKLDPASYRCLPALYRRIREFGWTYREMGKLQGAYRYARFRNRLRLEVFRQVQEALAPLKIDVVTLKGLALALSYYSDFTERPFDDLDLLIRPHDMAQTVKTLESAGFIREAERLRPQKGVNLIAPHGIIIDLHETLTLSVLDSSLNEACYRDRRVSQFEGIRFETLSPAHHLLHTLVHGLVWNAIPPFRWVLDAHHILRSPITMDWDEFLAQTFRQRFTTPVREGLCYLAREFQIEAPTAVTRRLAIQPTTFWEGWEFENQMLRPDETVFGWKFITRHLRENHYRSWPRTLVSLPAGVRRYFGLPSWRLILRELGTRFRMRRVAAH